MIYVSILCFVVGLVLIARSLLGLEELKPTRILDRVVLALLWTHVTIGFLTDILNYVAGK